MNLKKLMEKWNDWNNRKFSKKEWWLNALISLALGFVFSGIGLIGMVKEIIKDYPIGTPSSFAAHLVFFCAGIMYLSMCMSSIWESRKIEIEEYWTHKKSER